MRASSPSRSRRRRRSATIWSTPLIIFAAALAPLAAGGVHQSVILILCPAILLAVGILTVSEWRAGNRISISAAAIFPAAFAFLTAVQLLPLPPGIIDRLDPQAAALLAQGGGGDAGWRPLTLDPPATRQVLVRAVMAFLIFLAAYHTATKRNGRTWILRSVAATGVAAVVIGLGHRIFAIPKIYGIFPNTRHLALLTGPFINSNHTAEFLELATFVGIACARQAPTQLGRIGWYAAAVTCAAGALATLSRSSVFALGVGAAFLAVAMVRERPSVPTARARPAWLPAAVGLIGVVVVAASIGAGQLLDRFHNTDLGSDLRFRLWRDSLTVLRAHPLGIGRDAFDTVYPIYRTLAVPFPLRFSFVENQPLQMLIDFGYAGFFLLACAAVFPIRELIKNGRRDRVELALLAGILAVGAHSLTDFGLETLGVLLPFVVVLGTVLGRNHRPSEQVESSGAHHPQSSISRARGYVPIILGAGLGIVALWTATGTSSGRDFDADLKAAVDAPERRAVITDARSAHPLDYYYPLVLSTIEPLTSPGGRHSPRLRALNQALRLCLHCPDVHLEIARAMWRLGRRPQAIAEWSTAARGQAAIFQQSLAELAALGARPSELGRLAEEDPQRLLDVAKFLLGTAHPEQADSIITAASQNGASQLEVALLRARMKLAGPDPVAAEQAVAHVKGLAPTDSRVALLDAAQVLRTGGKDAGVQALGVVEHALDRDPNDLDLQRKRIEIVAQFERWSAADRSIVGFKQAFQGRGWSTAEANLAAAGIYLRLGRTREALAEYRIATTADPENAGLWRQFASAAEATKHYVLAREAYAQVMRLAPDRQVSEAMRRINDLQASERLGPRGQGGVDLDPSR